MYVKKKCYLCTLIFIAHVNMHVKHSTILRNMASLWLVQLANYLIPILVIPFVTRALGVDSFGKVALAQNIVSYLAILINFGFDYSATQDIATHRQDMRCVRVIFKTVMGSKCVLFGVSMAVMAVLYGLYAPVHADPWLYFWAAMFNLGFVLFPTWFYQGMEKMGVMSLFNFATKAVGAVLIIVLVRKTSDYVLYMAIQTLVSVVVGSCALGYIVRRYRICSSRDRDRVLSCEVLKKSAPVFVTNLAGSLYNALGITMLGAFLTQSVVGVYAGSQKIVQACIVMSAMPFSVAIFPRMSQYFHTNTRMGWQFLCKAMCIAFVAGMVLTPCLYVAAPWLVEWLLGNEFSDAVGQVRMLSAMPFLVLVGTMLLVQGLYGTQQQRLAPYIMVCTGGLSALLNYWLVPMMGATGCIVAWYVAETAEIVIVSIVLLRRYCKDRKAWSA